MDEEINIGDISISSDNEINVGDIGTQENEIVVPSMNIPALKGDKGDNGRGISSVTKTSTVGLVDTWTITYTDGSTSIFQVTNGADGQDGDDYVITSEDYQEIADIVENDITIPTKLSELQNDEGFIDNTVNNLQNYTKTSDLSSVATSGSYNDLSNKPTIPTKTSDLTNDSGFIDKNVNNLTNYTLKTNTGSLIDLEINQSNYVVSLSLKDIDGNVISSDNIDLPLESVVVGGSYDATNKKIVLTLENGNTVDIPVGDLIAGLQTEITSQNKLASDLVDDSNSGNKFVTTTEKLNWNNKLDESDLADYVKNTDYATSSTAGIVRIGTATGTYLNSDNRISATTRSYTDYSNDSNAMFIGKGTLENVITGKGLVSDTDYADSATGGVIKVSSTTGTGISGAGVLYASNSNYNTYNSASDYYFIGKGTLENVITGKNLATKSDIKTYYGTSATGATTQAKVVACEDFVLEEGSIIFVKFTNAQTYNGTATLNVNNTGAKDIARVGTTKTTRYYWSAGEIVGFIYDGANYLMIERGTATTTYFGLTKLYTGAGSDSQAYASTPRSLYYFANYSIAPYYSSSATYEVGDKVRYTYYLYECNTAIPTAEAWNAEHWTQIEPLQTQLDESQASQDEIISKLKADHPDIEEEGTDLSLQGTGDFDLALSPKGNITQDGEPSPTNPSPVKVIDGEYEVEVENKNKLTFPLSFSETVNGISTTENNGIYNLSGTTTSSGNITTEHLFSSNVLIKNNDYLHIGNNVIDNTMAIVLIFTDGTSTAPGLTSVNRIYDLSSSAGKTLSKIRFYCNSANHSINVELKPMILNNIAIFTDFVEYQHQTQTIDTSPNPLYSENDYYYKSNGEWYVHNEWGKVVLTGASSESWSLQSVNSYGIANFFIAHNLNSISGPAYSLCNYFINQTGGISTTTEEGYLWQNNGAYFRIKSTTASDVTNFKTWLNTNNITLVYKLNNPNNTPITNTTLINQLEALLTLTAYQDQTNISQTHNVAQADMIINAKTIMSLKYMQQEIEELKQAILNS